MLAPRSRSGSFSFFNCSLTEILIVMRVSGEGLLPVLYGAAMLCELFLVEAFGRAVEADDDVLAVGGYRGEAGRGLRAG